MSSARVSGNMGCKSTCCQKLTSCLGSALAWHNAHPCLYTWLDSSAFESTVTVSIERQREATASLKPTRSEFKYVIIEACTSESLTSNTYWLQQIPNNFVDVLSDKLHVAMFIFKRRYVSNLLKYCTYNRQKMPFVFIKHAIAANSISFFISSSVYIRKNDTSNSGIVLSARNKTLW